MASPALDAALRALDRLIPAVRGLARGVTWLAALAVGAVLLVVAVAAWARVATPLPTTVDWLLVLVVVGALLAAPAWLVATRVVLHSLLELPARLRDEPDLRRDQAAELADLARQAAEGERELSVPTGRRLWRTGRLVLDARRDLLAYVGLVRLASPLTLALTVAAALVAALEVVALPAVALGIALW